MFVVCSSGSVAADAAGLRRSFRSLVDTLRISWARLVKGDMAELDGVNPVRHVKRHDECSISTGNVQIAHKHVGPGSDNDRWWISRMMPTRTLIGQCSRCPEFVKIGNTL